MKCVKVVMMGRYEYGMRFLITCEKSALLLHSLILGRVKVKKGFCYLIVGMKVKSVSKGDNCRRVMLYVVTGCRTEFT
jgi:hypothetical protein